MPPKPKLKPKPVPRRGAAAAAAAAAAASAETAAQPESTPSAVAETDGSNPVLVGHTTPIPESVPIVPPAGRLDSLSTSSRNTQPSTRGAPLKFKPKFVQRKTKEEREAIDAKFEIGTTSLMSQPRGSFTRGPRGRGGARKDAGRGQAVGLATASGPFALGSVVSGRTKIAVERGSDLSNPHQTSFESSAYLSSKVKGENAEGGLKVDYSSSDESDGPKMDVEYISMLDEAHSQDEEGTQKTMPWGAGAPVRVPRREHVDRAAMVYTEASSKKEGQKDTKIKAKEEDISFGDEIFIKNEHSSDNDDIILPDAPGSPKRKSSIKQQTPQFPETKEKIQSTTTTGRFTRKVPKFRSEQHRMEWERMISGEQTTLKELCECIPSLKKIFQDEDEDITMDEKEKETESPLFWFQLPRFLPQLAPIPDLSLSKIKSEPTIAATTTTTSPETVIKPEPNISSQTPLPAPGAPQPREKKLTDKARLDQLSTKPPSCSAGKLRVHKSGRISILWGNPHPDFPPPVEFTLFRPGQSQVLHEVVVLKPESPWEDDIDEKGERKGVAISLGSVKSFFLVSPHITKLLKAVEREEIEEKKVARKARAAAREAGEVVEDSVEEWDFGSE